MDKKSSLIQANNLTKTYQLGETEVQALRGVSLKILVGEFVSIMGPSGSGKSTLMHLLGVLDTPTSGEYFLEGEKIDEQADLPRIRREKIGFVFQNFNLLARQSALANVELPMIYQGLSSAQRKTRAVKLLESVGLGKRLSHQPNQLSGGERQRVAIARALANQPKIILADEPTGNLDSRSGEEILNILKSLNQEQRTTLVIVTHEEYIASQAERTIRIRDGELVS